MLQKRNKFFISTTKHYGVFDSDHNLIFMSSLLEKAQAECDIYIKAFAEIYYIAEIESGLYSKD